MDYFPRWLCGLALFVLLLVPAQVSAQAELGRRFGFAAAIAVGGTPLGEIAERNGTFAIPGMQYELRALMRSANGTEWSLGLLMDNYGLDQEIDRLTHSQFDYSSTGLTVGYGRSQIQNGVPVRYGIDLGWRHFDASSSGPNYYTGEAEASHTRGHAAFLAVSYGIEIPLESISLMPRVRLETNYPDFGGGDGYSALHREHDLGFRASVGFGLKRMFQPERR
jgi:hypothetical protein